MKSDFFSSLPPPRPPSDRNDRWMTVGLIASLFAHLLLVGVGSLLPTGSSNEFVQKSEPVVVDLSNNRLPVVETLQETSKEAPKDARFASDRNLKTDEEMSPEGKLNRAPQVAGSPDFMPSTQQKARPPKELTESIKPKSVFKLSQADLLNDKNFQKETLPKAGPKGLLDPGFQERVNRGNALKLNARSFDYSNYILRMRTKLSQHWEPRKTVVPKMYQQRVVRVDIVVVLNNEGEVVELNTVAPSSFQRYDEEALRALRAAAPFPNPPDSLVQDDGNVYLTWGFILSTDSWGVGGANIE